MTNDLTFFSNTHTPSLALSLPLFLCLPLLIQT